MTTSTKLSLLAILFAACRHDASPVETRARVEVSGQEMKVIPAKGQYPFCLVFSASTNGVVRQVTLAEDNMSVPCSADRPIGDRTYPVPMHESGAKIYVVFSDRAIEAIPVAQQIRELTGKHIEPTAMDLRAPGNVAIAVIDVNTL